MGARRARAKAGAGDETRGKTAANLVTRGVGAVNKSCPRIEQPPVAIHGHGPGEPTVLPPPLHLPVSDQVRRRKITQDSKGGPPSAHNRGACPQLNVTDLSSVSQTVRILYYLTRWNIESPDVIVVQSTDVTEALNNQEQHEIKRKQNLYGCYVSRPIPNGGSD